MAWENPFRFGTDLWDPSNRFETSWLLSPWALFFCRALFSLYAFVTRFFVIGWYCTHESLGGCADVRQSFSYFTILTHWGLACYFFVAALHTLSYALRGHAFLNAWPRPLQALHSLFYTTVVTYPFLVTIVYWVVLYETWFTDEFIAWEQISQHALNSAFALFELFVPRTNPMPWVHIPFLILILAGYLAVAYITAATQGFYPYDFLDHDEIGGRGIVAGYILGIAAGIVVVFCIVWGLVWLRKWVTERKLGMDGKFASRPRSRDAEMGLMRSKYAVGSPF